MKTFRELATDIGEITTQKNEAYGSSFAKSGDFLRLLWPDGIPADRLDDALLLVRIFDKQMRIATSKDAFGESPYSDIGGYAILGLSNHQEKNATWPGSANAPDAQTSSKEQPSSAAVPAVERTTLKHNEAAAQPSSPPPAASSLNTTDAIARTVPADACASVAARALALNGAGRCGWLDASVAHHLGKPETRWLAKAGMRFTVSFCSQVCRDSFEGVVSSQEAQ